MSSIKMVKLPIRYMSMRPLDRDSKVDEKEKWTKMVQLQLHVKCLRERKEMLFFYFVSFLAFFPLGPINYHPCLSAGLLLSTASSNAVSTKKTITCKWIARLPQAKITWVSLRHLNSLTASTFLEIALRSDEYACNHVNLVTLEAFHL